MTETSTYRATAVRCSRITKPGEISTGCAFREGISSYPPKQRRIAGNANSSTAVRIVSARLAGNGRVGRRHLDDVLALGQQSRQSAAWMAEAGQARQAQF